MNGRVRTGVLISGMIAVAFLVLGSKTAEASGLHKAPNNLGLVGYWSFEDASGLRANDFSGHGNTGTLANGPAFTAGKIGRAISFDGSEDIVSVEGVADDIATGNVTMSAWVKFPTTYANGSPSAVVF